MSNSTSTSSCTHCLELDNLANGEIVSHSILLIKGRAYQKKSLTYSKSTANDKCVVDSVQLQHRSIDQPDNATAQAVLVHTCIGHSGQFKLLLDLKRYEALNADRVTLELNLEYCNLLKQLRIVYQPDITPYRLQPLYIQCVAEEDPLDLPAHDACQVIDLNLRVVQCLYAEQLRVGGFGRRTFQLNAPCQVFHSQLSRTAAWQCSEDALWQHFAHELLNREPWNARPQLKFVAFIDCTSYDGAAVAATGDFSYANIRRHLRAHAALGGGGLALFGSAYFYAWPRHFSQIVDCLRSARLVDCAQQPDDSNYRGTFGGVYASTLGAIVHEIGHIFELGHTSDGIMGSGFDYVNRVFTVDQRTENLPDRIVQAVTPQQSVAKPRFTQLKKSTNSFLDKYHQQRANEAFYFTRNCLVILAHHQWLSGSSVNPAVDVIFNVDGQWLEAIADSLKLVEVRSNVDSLVKCWYELQKQAEEVEVERFQLPSEAIAALKENCYIFVITKSGYTKRLCESG